MLQPVSETQDCTMMYCTSFIAENLHRYTVFKVQNSSDQSVRSNGGLKRNRTFDLTVISRAL